MGSSEEINYFDNSNELDYADCISLCKKYFVQELPSFKPEREYFDPKGYWGIYFVNGPIEVFLGSERSFFAFTFKINGTNIYLPSIDNRLYKLERLSKKNVLFLLDFIKDYLIKNQIS